MFIKKQYDTLDEKELKKQKEKIMKLMGIPLTTMLIHGHTRSPMEITTTEGSNLIPRVINTHIQVYAITLDVVMESSRSCTHNSRHGPRANNNVVNSNIDDLHRAASCGKLEVVEKAIGKDRELLKNKYSDGSLPLHLAVANSHKEVALFLVEKYPQGSYALNNSNMSPLYHAVRLQHLDLVKDMFCKLATDKNVLDCLKKGKSIVHAAITNKDQGMLKTILKSQRDLIKCTDEEGLTPLSYAAYKGFVDIVEYIMKKFPKSVDNYKNDDKSYPIHKACLGGHLEVLESFHRNSPKSFQSEDELGRTILHLAAKERCNKLKHIVSYLLTLNEGRQLIKKQDEYGSTPLDLAIEFNNNEVAQLIR